jgi:hypothetical protein
MGSYRLIENEFVGSKSAQVLGGLFHQPAFFRLHAAGPASYFQWADDERVAASIHFTAAADGLWRSPARGTFAGYACRPDLPVEESFAFHDAVEARLAAQGARRIEVLPAPMAHDPVAFANQLYLLSARGYEITQCDLNQGLEVNMTPLTDRMTYGNVKRLRKCKREGLSAQPLPANSLGDVYDTLAVNRASKGHAMSMTLTQLQTMADTFPDALALFGCRDGERLAAAALCLRLSAAVMYVFYWGDQPGYGSLSPVVPLAEAIYSYCQEHGVRLLDVGTSTVDREPNFGLLQFKRGLGFTESLKVRMSKKL